MTPPTHIPVSKSDLKRIILYLDAAAVLYADSGRQRDRCRAWCISQMTSKLNNKLIKQTTT